MQSSLKLLPLSFQGTKISLPFFQTEFSNQEKTVVITAGFDGDEYAGIEAAYKLIQRYQTARFPFHLIILPIVNTVGFFQGTAKNPLDNRYPKDIFPGNETGSFTEQLIATLYTSYLKKADLWIDLHSGDTTESLSPFLWGYETANSRVNDRLIQLLPSSQNIPMLYTKAAKKDKASLLAQQGTIYMLLESGERGKRTPKAIQQHLSWVHKLLSNYHYPQKKTAQKKVYTTIYRYLSPASGLWYPSVKQKTYQKNTILGTLCTLDQRPKKILTTTRDGLFLWRKESMQIQKNDIVYALAADSTLLSS